MIAKNMFTQADNDGHNVQILSTFFYFSKDRNVVDKSDMRLRTKSGQQCLFTKPIVRISSSFGKIEKKNGFR